VEHTQLYFVNLNLLQEVSGQQMSGAFAGLTASSTESSLSGKKFTGTIGAGALKSLAYSEENNAGVFAHSSGGRAFFRQRPSSSGLFLTGNGTALMEVKPVPSPKLKWLMEISNFSGSLRLSLARHFS
jgi:hypothetical protein